MELLTTIPIFKRMRDAICWKEGVFADLERNETEQYLIEFARRDGLCPEEMREILFRHLYRYTVDPGYESIEKAANEKNLFMRFLSYFYENHPLHLTDYKLTKGIVERSFLDVFVKQPSGFSISFDQAQSKEYCIHQTVSCGALEVDYRIFGKLRKNSFVNFTMEVREKERVKVTPQIVQNLFCDFIRSTVCSEEQVEPLYMRYKAYSEYLTNFFNRTLS